MRKLYISKDESSLKEFLNRLLEFGAVKVCRLDSIIVQIYVSVLNEPSASRLFRIIGLLPSDEEDIIIQDGQILQTDKNFIEIFTKQLNVFKLKQVVQIGQGFLYKLGDFLIRHSTTSMGGQKAYMVDLEYQPLLTPILSSASLMDEFVSNLSNFHALDTEKLFSTYNLTNNDVQNVDKLRGMEAVRKSSFDDFSQVAVQYVAMLQQNSS